MDDALARQMLGQWPPRRPAALESLDFDIFARRRSCCHLRLGFGFRSILFHVGERKLELLEDRAALRGLPDLHFDPTTNIIDVYVGRVRRKVDVHQAYPLIHTIRGVGFCVRAP